MSHEACIENPEELIGFLAYQQNESAASSMNDVDIISASEPTYDWRKPVISNDTALSEGRESSCFASYSIHEIPRRTWTDWKENQRNRDIPKCLEGFEAFFVENWDTFGADSVSELSFDIACFIIFSLPPRFQNPESAPGADGSICMEWIFPDGEEIFIDIGPGKLISAKKFPADQEVAMEFDWGLKDLVSAQINKLFENLSIN